MSKRFIPIAAFLLSCCDTTPATIAQQKRNPAVAPFPTDHATGFRRGYSLRVPRHGEAEWNGASVSKTVLSGYLREFAALPREAGPLVVAFEPGVAAADAAAIRGAVIASGLCRQQRCFEESWNMKRPVIN